MNILLNDGYSFQRGIPVKSVLNHMSLEELDFALKFAQESNDNTITINGAEAMYFDHWEYLVDKLLQSNFTTIAIFTNCIDLERNYLSLIKLVSNNSSDDEGAGGRRNIMFVTNYNDEKSIGTKYYEEMKKGFDMLRRLPNSQVIMNINLYDTDQDFKTPLEEAARLKTRNVRWSFTDPDEVNKYRGNIVDFYQSKLPMIKNFFLECVKLKLRPVVDCHSIPLCMYDDEMLRLIGMIAEENLKKSGCQPFIDVGPGLETSRCFAYRGEKHNLASFINITDVEQLFVNMIDNRDASKDLLPECNTCASKVAQGQSCGCLQFRKVEVL
jgi:hypothetical protein